MELFSLLAIVLGIFGGFKLMGEGMVLLHDKYNADQSTLPYISFALIFLIIVLVVTMIGKAIRHSIDKSFLGKMDQVMGLLLGAAKTLFMLSVALWLIDSLKMNIPEAWTEDSALLSYTARLAPISANWISQFFPFLKETFRSF